MLKLFVFAVNETRNRETVALVIFINICLIFTAGTGVQAYLCVFLPPGAPRSLFSHVPTGAACVRGESQGAGGFPLRTACLCHRGSLEQVEQGKGCGVWALLLWAILSPCLSLTFLICEMGTGLFQTTQGCCEDYMKCPVDVGSFIQGSFTEQTRGS